MAPKTYHYKNNGVNPARQKTSPPLICRAERGRGPGHSNLQDIHNLLIIEIKRLKTIIRTLLCRFALYE